MERDIVQLRGRDKQIGDSLGWIVDVLLQDEEGTKDEERLKKEKREAIESLAYIRDILISDGLTLEDDRLFGEEETSRRKARAHRQEELTSAGPKAVLPPAPLPVMDTRPKATGHRSRMEGRTWLSPQDTKGGPGGPALAPWNYTRSSFSESSALPSGSLPRPPPPTSTRLRRSVERKGEERGYEDPLGAVHVHSKY
jgi:TBC1 domain family protein 5